MIHINIFISSAIILSSMVLYDFSEKSNLNNWRIVDDVVMGGRSDGHFEINQDGHAVFYGKVSLENNGGFSSVRYRSGQEKIEGFSKVLIRLRGDGKKYQFRVKSDKYDRHSYIYYFQTSGQWQDVEIPLLEMEPGFRGRRLNMPNYPAQFLEEIAFLISNKVPENFRLEIDKITLK